MSMEAVAKFYEKMKEEEPLRKEAKDIQDQAALIAFAKEKGFDFTAGEMAAFAARQAKEAVPLSDEEVDQVAAGWLYSPYGYLMTMATHSCNRWSYRSRPWASPEGQCGSCDSWKGDFMTAHLKLPATCGHPDNCKK